MTDWQIFWVVYLLSAATFIVQGINMVPKMDALRDTPRPVAYTLAFFAGLIMPATCVIVGVISAMLTVYELVKRAWG